MRRSHQPRVAMVVAAGAAVAASLLASCGGHSKAKTAPTSTVAPTTVASTTTVAPSTTAPPTTVAPAGLSPLTGLPQISAAQLNSPAVVVKVDNVDAARPQTGINQADVVYEELVEGGLTRLAAVFQSDYPDPVGPVRSGRLTDSAIADDLNHPVFAYAGTNANFLPILRSQPLSDVDLGNSPNLFFREDLAPEPHNLYTDVSDLAPLDTVQAPPSALFPFRPAGAPFAGAGMSPAAAINIPFPAASIVWTADAATGAWARDQNGTPDVDRAGQQVTAANVIVQFVPYISSGIASGEGVADVEIPEGELVGSGQVWVLSGNGIVKGTWSRSALTTTTSFVDTAGAPIQMAPGRTWVELVPTGTVPSVQP